MKTLALPPYFRLRPIRKQAWDIAYPVIVAQLAQNVISLVDTAFLGRLSTTALAAGGLANVWYYTVIILVMGLGSGLQILVARREGEQRPQEAGRSVDTAFYVGIILAVGMMAMFRWGTEPLAYRFCTSADVAAGATTYLQYRAFDVLFVMGAFLLRGFLNGIERNRVIILSAVVMTLLNIVLNYTLMFGHFGFPAMGIAGAAIASVIAEIVGFGVLLGYVLRRRLHLQYGFFRWAGPDWGQLRILLTVAAPMMGQMLMSIGSYLFFFWIIEGMGEDALAVSNVAKSVYIGMMPPVWGFTTAISTMVSNLVGRRKFDAVLPTTMSIAKFSLASSGGFYLVLLLAPRLVLSIFTNDAALIEEAAPLMRMVSATLTIYSVTGIWLNAVIGLGATRFAFLSEVVTLTAYLGYLVVAAFVFEAGLTALWASEFIYMVFMGLLPVIYLYGGRWRQIRI